MGALSRVNKEFNKPSTAYARDLKILENQYTSNSNIQSVQDQLNAHKMQVAYYECLKMNDQIIAIYGDDKPIYDCHSIYQQ